MVLPQFEYLAPKTIGEACNLLLELGSTARVMAGATDLIPPMKDKVISPEYIIDLKKIPGLDYLEYDDREGLKIGALTTLRTIETSPLVKEKNPAVAHAAKVVASTQIRTKGTMAGNICNASPSCDTAPNLLAQGAKILVQGPNKDRVIQIEDFFLGVKKTSLELGFIGCVVVIALFLLIIYECLMMAARARDLSGRLICVGMATLIAFQAFANIAVATGIFPNTGLPLPFISFGSSSLISIFMGIGLVLNVGLQRETRHI